MKLRRHVAVRNIYINKYIEIYILLTLLAGGTGELLQFLLATQAENRRSRKNATVFLAAMLQFSPPVVLTPILFIFQKYMYIYLQS